MTYETLEYRVDGVGVVRIPGGAPAEANKLLCDALADAMTGGSETISDNNIFTRNPGLLSVLISYRDRKIPIGVAEPVVILNIAEQMANGDENYCEIRRKIAQAHNVVWDNYQGFLTLP